MQRMKNNRRLLAASIDGIVLWVVVPFCVLLSELQFPGRALWAPAVDAIILGGVICLEAVGRSSFGMWLTRSRIVRADTSDAGLPLLLLRAGLKYFPVLILVPQSAVDSLGLPFGDGYVMVIVFYSLTLLIGTYCSIMVKCDGAIDLLLGLSVRSIDPYHDDNSQARGFHVVGFDYPQRSERTEEQNKAKWL